MFNLVLKQNKKFLLCTFPRAIGTKFLLLLILTNHNLNVSINMKKLLFLIIILQLNFLFAQESLFIKAENGLIIRENPDTKSTRIGKFDYAEKIKLHLKTGKYISIIDNGNTINGEWYEVSGNDINQNTVTGYVFSGFLTSEFLKKKTKIKFKNFIVEFEHIQLWNSESILSRRHKDTVKLYINLPDSPENKIIKIKPNEFKNIEILQRFQNSITIMDDGSHRDLINWKHYNSDWEKIPFIDKENGFKTLKYSKSDWEKFIPIKITEFQDAVEKQYGERWAKLISEIKSVNEYPSGIAISKIFIKIIITHNDNSITEKIIEFEIPMGC